MPACRAGLPIMPLNYPRFIVFEGLDGAGTTTQAAKLQAYFTRRGTASFLTNEPTSEPIGAFIRRLLTGKEGAGGKYHPGERAMGLLFAADRLAAYKHPEALEVVPELPLTAMQKLDRARLRHQFGNPVGHTD